MKPGRAGCHGRQRQHTDHRIDPSFGVYGRTLDENETRALPAGCLAGGHQATFEQDSEVGALLGIIGGGFGKGVQGLLAGLGPRMMPALAGAGLLGDLGGGEGGLSGLAAMVRRGDWDKPAQEIKDRIRGDWNRGNDFNARRKGAYDYSEVRLEPPADDEVEPGIRPTSGAGLAS